jgi:hypothetical protein
MSSSEEEYSWWSELYHYLHMQYHVLRFTNIDSDKEYMQKQDKQNNIDTILEMLQNSSLKNNKSKFLKRLKELSLDTPDICNIIKHLPYNKTIVPFCEIKEPHIFRHYSWGIKEDPNKTEIYIYDDETDKLTDYESVKSRSPTEEEWDRYVINSKSIQYLSIPTDSFRQNTYILQIGRKVSYRILTNTIYEFYKKSLTKEQIEDVREFYEDDSYDYKKHFLKNVEKGKDVCYAELMSDCSFFEGIERISDNIWKLSLGS